MYDVIIIGGGPAGLAAAIAATRRNLSYVVLEKGALVNSILHFPTDMIFFTTPELLEIGGLPFVSQNEKPTRHEALKYYRRVTDAFQLTVEFGERVDHIGRDGEAFVVRSASGERRGRAVVLATGSYDLINRMGIPGEELPHVSHYYREAHPYYRKRVVIVGGKNSAAEVALDLYRNASLPTIVHRHPAMGDSIKYWVKPDIENRIKEGSIPAHFNTHVREITPAVVRCEGPSGAFDLPADAVLLMTGYHGDTSLATGLGAKLDDSTDAPVHDPATFETTVPNLYMAGAVVAGRQQGRIFIENGRFHGEVVIAEIARRAGRG